MILSHEICFKGQGPLLAPLTTTAEWKYYKQANAISEQPLN